MHSKCYVSTKSKTSYNLEWREYYAFRKAKMTAEGVPANSILVLISSVHSVRCFNAIKHLADIFTTLSALHNYWILMPLMELVSWKEGLWRGCHFHAPYIGVSNVDAWRTRLKEHFSLQCVGAVQEHITGNVFQGTVHPDWLLRVFSLYSCSVLMRLMYILGNYP